MDKPDHLAKAASPLAASPLAAALSGLRHPLLAGLVELLYPTRCVICERPGELICADDRRQLPYIDQSQACPRCGAPFGRLLCTECIDREGQQQFAFQAAFSLLALDRRAEALILVYKDENERRLAGELAALLAAALPLEWRLWADGIAWVPADRVARQRRGFDHMALLAGELALRLGLPALDLLTKEPLTDQRWLSRQERRTNAVDLFGATLPDSEGFGGAHIHNLLLLDDVFTTGATLDAAATCLLAAADFAVRALTVARVW